MTERSSIHSAQRPVERSEQDARLGKRPGNANVELYCLALEAHAERGIEVGCLRRADFSNGIPKLAEALGFARRQEGEIRLIVGIDARHQFDIGAIFVGKVPVPGITELMITPGPLLLPGRDVMVGYVYDTGLGSVIVSAEEVQAACRSPCSWSVPGCWRTSSDHWLDRIRRARTFAACLLPEHRT